MRFLQAIFLLISLSLPLTGCIHDSLDGCPPKEGNDVTLHFRYPDTNGDDIFPAHVNKVDLVIFDASGRYVTQLTVDKNALDAFQGAKLKLDPGTYTVVCWGNAASGLCSLTYTTTLDNACLVFTSNLGCSPLYYAPTDGTTPFTFTVPVTGAVEKIIDFARAYNIIDVYVQNFDDPGSSTHATRPVIEITGLPPGYDYFKCPLGRGTTTSFSKTSEMITTPDGAMANAAFLCSNFNTDNSIYIHIKRVSDGALIHSVSLTEFLAAHSLTLTGQNNKTTTILITFANGDISIALPAWTNSGTKPGFD